MIMKPNALAVLRLQAISHGRGTIGMAGNKNGGSRKTNPRSVNDPHNKQTGISIITANARLIPVMLILAVIPLIFRLYQYDSGLAGYDFFAREGISHDFALHGKMVAFTAVSACMAAILIYRGITKKKLLFTKVFIPLIIYGFLALLSSIFSEYQSYPWTGIFEQFEPCFVLIGYVIAAYYTFLCIEREEDVKILVFCLAAGAAVLAAIGLMQAFLTDPFDTELGKWLTIPSKYYRQLSGTGEEFRHKFKIWRVFMTFSNPNYVGSYVPLVWPVVLILAFNTKKTGLRIFYGILSAGLIVCLFGSGSKTGFVGLIVSMAVVAVYLVKSGRKTLTLSVAGAFAVLMILYVILGNNDYLSRIKSVFNFEKTEYEVTGIETLDDGVRIVYRGNGLIVSFEPERLGFSCRDDNGEELYMSLNNEQKLTLDDERFTGVTIRPVELDENTTGFEIFASRNWYFARLNGEYYYYTPYGKYIKHTISESAKWLDEHGKLATGRGFLWARTLPLLKSNIILGSGADTFALEYPGADYVASYNSGNWGFIVTKPHCMYLQIAVQTGVLSLIALLGYILMYFTASTRCLSEMVTTGTSVTTGKGDFSTGMIWAVMAGTAGYMTAAVFNDSSIAIAPVFWVLTGMGLGLVKIKKKD